MSMNRYPSIPPRRSLPEQQAIHTYQTRTTTGTGQQTAQQAHGVMTLYNAAPYAQTIPAGQIITGGSGVEIVTDQTAFIPAAVLPTEGQVTVTAHAVQAGPAGNIRGGEAYGACCQANIFVTNGPFTSGQDAKRYHMVTQQDIARAVTSLKANLAQSTRAVFQAQAHHDETVLLPLSCTPKMMTNKKAGDAATQVTVTLDESCQRVAYRTAAMTALVQQITDAAATQQRGEQYQQVKDVQWQTINQQQHSDGETTLQVKATGLYSYQFSSQQITEMSKAVAGETEEQAKQALLQAPGIQSVSIEYNEPHKALPTDVYTIHFVVMQ